MANLMLLPRILPVVTPAAPHFTHNRSMKAIILLLSILTANITVISNYCNSLRSSYSCHRPIFWKVPCLTDEAALDEIFSDTIQQNSQILSRTQQQFSLLSSPSCLFTIIGRVYTTGNQLNSTQRASTPTRSFHITSPSH